MKTSIPTYIPADFAKAERENLAAHKLEARIKAIAAAVQAAASGISR